MNEQGSRIVTDADAAQIAAHGLTVEEVKRQLALFADPPGATRLERACRVGDGIVRISESEWTRYQELFQKGVAEGRFSKFVPASGAAGRLFRDLSAARNGDAGDAAQDAARRLLDELDRFPFAADLREAVDKQGGDAGSTDPAPFLEALLDGDGLGFAQSAKALIPFHRGEDGRGLTALEEQLVETVDHLKDAEGNCRLHLTIPQHQELEFREHLRAITARLEESHGVSFHISLSIQGPETDTVAGDLDGGPFRDDDGKLVFRPGGHGALLKNLESFGPDLVFIRNIDNIQPAHRRREVLRWNRILGGYLLELEAELVRVLSHVERVKAEDPSIDGEIRHMSKLLGRPDLLPVLERPARAKQAFLIDWLDRPLRLAGVVPNTGEPGGGPFWVRSKDEAGDETVSPQIVELSQVDMDDPEQRNWVGNATHFNPVHLVCRLRNHRGELYPLDRFVDPSAVFLSRKSHGGRELRALERPGLWNGSMARWNTVFVEVPGAIFAPVKTVFDLLRPEHQPETAD